MQAEAPTLERIVSHRLGDMMGFARRRGHEPGVPEWTPVPDDVTAATVQTRCVRCGALLTIAANGKELTMLDEMVVRDC